MSKDKNREESDDEEIVFENIENSSSFGKDPLVKLRKKLKKSVEEKQEYLDGWQRSKADFVNFKKRTDDERKDFIKYANESLIFELLPVLDSFDMALDGNTEGVSPNWQKGMEYVRTQLKNTLENGGAKEINPLGDKFDPAEHNSLEVVEVEDNKKNGVVVEVVTKGYSLNGKIIRPANVKVGEKK
jgi:molecular chaperone GrpE